MVAKYPFLWIIFIFLFTITSFSSLAQPTLPDIAGVANKGIVVLSWNSQYSAIKSINVLRSVDSVVNFHVAGSVKKINTGIQAFVDGHPASGRNFYKLVITFKSGLTWTSNHCSVVIEASAATAKLPPNDSLQRYIVTSDTLKNGKGNTTVVSATPPKDFLAVDPEDLDSDDDKPEEPKKKVYISFNMDTAHAETRQTAVAGSKATAPKFIVSFDEPDVTTAPTFIKSLYVFTDAATGHVRMNLPEDVVSHSYSVKFYDQQNHLVAEVPKIGSAHIIFDKRNFQHKGTYKFVLRKDVVELEQGYVEIK